MIKRPIGKILPPETEGTGPPGNALDQLRLPTLDERAELYLRAIHGERDFTDQEHSAARDRLLDEMADAITVQSGGHSRDPDAPRPESTDFRPGAAAAAASAGISDEDLDWPNADYSASEAPAARESFSSAIAFRSVAPSQSAIHDAHRSPARRVETGPSLASIDLSRSHPERRPAIESRWRPIAKHRMFRAIAAIAALLLVAGAYRLVLLSTEEVKPVHTAFGPSVDDSRKQFELLQECPGSSNEVALRQRRIESCAGVAATGPTRPAGQNPDTALLRAPNSPLAAGAAYPKNVDAIADKVRRGQALTASGQILAARFVLKEAADANSAEAALALGMTYDPTELNNLGVRNVLPEPDAARRWYQKAKDLGSTEAQGRLEKLAAREGQVR
jgi:hypothetical protein